MSAKLDPTGKGLASDRAARAAMHATQQPRREPTPAEVEAFVREHPHGGTLEEVGLVFGVTRERIRQIEGKALRKLAHNFPLLAERLLHEASHGDVTEHGGPPWL